jgi:hypothetical protein
MRIFMAVTSARRMFDLPSLLGPTRTVVLPSETFLVAVMLRYRFTEKVLSLIQSSDMAVK